MKMERRTTLGRRRYRSSLRTLRAAFDVAVIICLVHTADFAGVRGDDLLAIQNGAAEVPGVASLLSKSADGKSYIVDDFAAVRLEVFDDMVTAVLHDKFKKIVEGDKSATISKSVLDLTRRYPSRAMLALCANNISARPPSIVSISSELDLYPCCRVLLAAGSESVAIVFNTLYFAPDESITELDAKLLSIVLMQNYGREIRSDAVRISDLLRSLDRAAEERNPQAPTSSKNFKKVASAIRAARGLPAKQ